MLLVMNFRENLERRLDRIEQSTCNQKHSDKSIKNFSNGTIKLHSKCSLNKHFIYLCAVDSTTVCWLNRWASFIYFLVFFFSLSFFASLPVSLARTFSIMRFLWWHVFIIVYKIFCEPSKFLLKCLHFIERWAHMILSDILSHHEQIYWYYMEMWRFSGKLYVFTMRKILKISRQTKKLRF